MFQLKNISYPFFIILLFSACQGKEHQKLSFDSRTDSNFEEELQKANEINKPLLLYFNAYGSAGARRMEKQLLADKEVVKEILDNYTFVSLYVDDKREAKIELWKKDQFSSRERILKRVGGLNVLLQTWLTASGSQPTFSIVTDTSRNHPIIGYTTDKETFLNFLKKGGKTKPE